MAKKKKTKAAKKVTSRPAENSSEEELLASLLVTIGGETPGSLGTAIARLVDRAVENYLAAHTREEPQEVAEPDGSADRAISIARNVFRAMDYTPARKPYLRTVGRVAEILLNHRGFETCSTGDIFRVFLIEIPNELLEQHRQTPPPGEDVDVSTGDGRRKFNNRTKELRQMELIRSTVTRGSREEGYILTEDGQNLFDGWPELSEIPGLQLHPPTDTQGGSAG